ncbi:hypothetical protein GQ43DRAFT_239012 [Delitschia confertaspora ATCC 74209]|uniref:Archaemetzincin-2 n=1 Tax=Delitschia confertaspora ATCC 74209 TaxID=1513339 RepID=A0A9P4JSV5_9PLEO|nr:hypothetical protein GQ43DRAFT_239012 [Delitschia confertaspora ATCC 74209]
MAEPCNHKSIYLEPSAFAEEAGFERLDASRRAAETTNVGSNQSSNKKQIEKEAKVLSASFPGPLVLPWDDLNLTPDYPPQSFRTWLNDNGNERNKPTKAKRTLYLVNVPNITKSVEFMAKWTTPNVQPEGPPRKKAKVDHKAVDLSPPDAQDIAEYLEAFYHGLPVKIFPERLRFTPWEERCSAKRKEKLKYIGLAHGGQCTRIRVRQAPDGVFQYQLNLNDILTVAMRILPSDAYAVVLLVNHDMYEHEDDVFCCGRAYGASRISVVQAPRYHPMLDHREKINHAHMWPASHCKEFVNKLCAEEDVKPKKVESKPPVRGPMHAAVAAVSKVTSPSTPDGLQALWFSRVARTVSHELGHCFGLDHCVYYACNMQGCSGMQEDVRQAPYLCPVCLAKVSYAIACELQGADEDKRKEYVRKRYEALAEFCGKWKGIGLFVGYEAWLKARLEILDAE